MTSAIDWQESKKETIVEIDFEGVVWGDNINFGGRCITCDGQVRV